MHERVVRPAVLDANYQVSQVEEDTRWVID